VDTNWAQSAYGDAVTRPDIIENLAVFLSGATG
jgi:hypothetical protein